MEGTVGIERAVSSRRRPSLGGSDGSQPKGYRRCQLEGQNAPTCLFHCARYGAEDDCAVCQRHVVTKGFADRFVCSCARVRDILVEIHDFENSPVADFLESLGYDKPEPRPEGVFLYRAKDILSII